MAIIYFDMDGVLANFNGAIHRELKPKEKPSERLEKNFYLNLKPINETIELVQQLIGNGHDVYIASKPSSSSLYCASEKYAWVRKHIPELTKKVILTGHKHLLTGNYLIDDRPEEWSKFGGKVLYFNPDNVKGSINKIISVFRENGVL